MIVGAQPVEDASAVAGDVAGLEKSAQSDDSSAFDLEPSESGLKVIEHKLEHWLKKYNKHQDKNSNHGNKVRLNLIECFTILCIDQVLMDTPLLATHLLHCLFLDSLSDTATDSVD